MLEDRQYQTVVIQEARAEIAAGRRRVLIVAPTGAGKTVIVAAMIREAEAAGERALFLAHRRELVIQAASKLYDFGVDAGVIQAGHPTRPLAPVQVASVQTLHARAVRGSAIEMPRADLVIVDEAHHVGAPTYRQILDAYPDAIVIGITATPCRGDGRGLGSVFDTIVECPQVGVLVAQGYLVPTIVYAPSVPDLRGVPVSRGDYAQGALEQRMDTVPLVGDVVTEWLRVAEGRSTVVFAAGVGHSIHLRDEFRRAGVSAEHVDGTTPAAERDAILKRLADADVEVVTNFGVLTEGWDCPSVSCAVLARPTKSMSLYRQMAGRVLRPAPGKENALILDHAGLTFAHGFVEDEVVWTLKEDHRAVNVTHAARRAVPGMQSLSACPKCRAVRVGGKPCTACGWRPQPKPMHVEVQEGELARIDRDGRQQPSMIDRARFHGMLVHIARERGYKPGWAAFTYKEKFGTWPDSRMAMPITPDAATLAWVRHRMIAHAKRRDKQRGAA